MVLIDHFPWPWGLGGFPFLLIRETPEIAHVSSQRSLIQVYARSFQQTIDMVGVLVAVLSPLEQASFLELVLVRKF